MMRTMLSISVLLLASACNVSKDGNAVTVQYDQNTAENVAGDVSNTAQDVGGMIANDVKETGEKVQNIDVDVNASTNSDGNAL
jgi:hypothetical protein